MRPFASDTNNSAKEVKKIQQKASKGKAMDLPLQ